MKLMMLGLGKPKDKPEGGPERDYAREAFSALKDDDEDGFVEAFISAVRACKGGTYGEDDEDGDEE